MATKKNPLSALLSSDERQQAEEFTRDHVTRSAVRQAGTYRVNAKRLLPMSQTSLGRMASSLGTVSGILNQFSEYQLKKEQAELKGEGIEQQIAMQDIAGVRADQALTGAQIRGQTLHESVKQQNIQLAQTERAIADEEFDQRLAKMLPEQQAAFYEQVEEDVRLTKRAQASAERALETGNPADFVYSPLFNKRTRLIMGATYAQEYMRYYATELEEKLKRLPDHKNAAMLSPEEAQEMTELILTQFMEEKGLNPDDEIGDGFIASVKNFNEANLPHSASQMRALSRELSLKQLKTAISQHPKELAASIAAGKPRKDIKDTPWFIQLLGLASPDRAEVLFDKNKGVFAMMNRTHEGALEAQLIFDELADTLTLGVGPDGKPSLMREDGRFLGWQADIDDAITSAASKETAANNSLFTGVMAKTKNYLEQMIVEGDITGQQMTELVVNITSAGDTVEEVRASIDKHYPGLAAIMDPLPEDMVYQYLGSLTRHAQSLHADYATRTDLLIASANANYKPGDTGPGLFNTVQDLKTFAANIPAGDLKDEYEAANIVLSTYSSGLAVVGGEGLVTARNGIEVERVMREFSKDSKGLDRQHRNRLNALDTEVRASLGEGYTSGQFQESYAAALEAEQERYQKEVFDWALNISRKRKQYLAYLDARNKEGLKAMGRNESRLLDPKYIIGLAGRRPEMPPKELEATALKVKAFAAGSAPLAYVNRLTPKNPEDAQNNLNALAVIEQHFDAGVNSYMKPGEDNYEALVSVTAAVGSGGLGWFQWQYFPMFDSEAGQLRKLTDGASKAIAARHKVSLDIEAITTIAGDYQGRGPVQVGTRTTWLAPAMEFTRRTTMETGGWAGVGGELAYAAGTKEVKDYTHPSVSRWGLSQFAENEDGDPIVHREYHLIADDPSVPEGFYAKFRPPIKGIPFGDIPPTLADVERIRTELGISEVKFKKLYNNLYGYDKPLQFLIDQWNEPIYMNERALK